MYMAVMHMEGSRSASLGLHLKGMTVCKCSAYFICISTQNLLDRLVRHISLVYLIAICQLLCLAIYFSMHIICLHVSLFNFRMPALSSIFQFLSHLKDLLISIIKAMDAIHKQTSLSGTIKARVVYIFPFPLII